MNKEIKQICLKMNTQDILNKQFYPVWFFTNEKMVNFLVNLCEQEEIKNIFSVGSGDFAFNCLSAFDNISEINVCDIRPLANLTMDLKIGLIKKLSFEEFQDLFKDFDAENKNLIYQKIRDEIRESSRSIFDPIIYDQKPVNFVKCLEKSGYWYRYSFLKRHKRAHIAYLNQDKYSSLQQNIDKVEIYFGDFNDNLKLSDNNFYDLIYVSNIFDSKKYCVQKDAYLQTIQQKLNRDGYLLVVTMHRPEKIIKLLKKYEFQIYKRENSKFSMLKSLFFLDIGEYDWSFLVFRRIS